MFRNVLLTVFPEFALTCIDSGVPTMTSVLRGLLTGVTGILAAIAAGWGPPTYLEEPGIKSNAQVLVFYDLCFASRGKSKKGSYVTTDEFSAQLDLLRPLTVGREGDPHPRSIFTAHTRLMTTTSAEEASRLIHDRDKTVGTSTPPWKGLSR